MREIIGGFFDALLAPLDHELLRRLPPGRKPAATRRSRNAPPKRKLKGNGAHVSRRTRRRHRRARG